MKILKRVSALAAFAILLFIGQQASAGASGCSDLARANPNDLLALPEVGSVNSSVAPDSPSVNCTWKGPGPKSEFCGPKPTIIQDKMLARDRRLLLVSSSLGDDVFVFGCLFGQVKRLSESSDLDMRGEIRVQQAERGRFVLTSSKPPTPGTSQTNRMVFNWDPKVQRYLTDGADDKDISPPSATTLACDQLKTAKANDLIILANGDFTEGSGGYPFTHGLGCYSIDPQHYPDQCEWFVEVDEDRMISADRRLIVFDSDHRAGTGTWGYVYVFGCVAGQIRTVYGGDFLQGGGVVEPAVPERSIEPTPALTAQILSGSWGEGVAKAEHGAGRQGPVQLLARARPTATAAPRAQRQKSPMGNADTLVVSGCAEYPCRGEVLYTYKWNAALNNYILTDVHYEPD
jgi:hypothetical protein